jgi:aerobic-type carbon monoxide dehydrogenase small subunit (CoxS/CutS family)
MCAKRRINARGGRRRSAAPTGTAPIFGPGKVPVQLIINGRPFEAQLEPCVTLLDAMRDFCGLNGAKRVCDRAECGACTVLINGKREYACSLLAIDVQSDAITTIESLDEGGVLDSIQSAFLQHDAMQCGFCTAGFVMSCKAFLAENPDPTPDEIRKGLSGNLCRCGTYMGIQAAVAEAAQSLKAQALKPQTKSPRAPRGRTRARS